MTFVRKLKPCNTCSEPSYIWAHGNCKHCDAMLKIAYQKEQQVTLRQTDSIPAKPFRVIKKVSDKQAKLNRIYAITAAIFKGDNSHCMAKLPECNGVTSDVHHLFSGASRSKYYLDTTEWIAVCVSCHHKIHNILGKDELIELGLKKIE